MNSSRNKKVSVVVPNYNYARYIEKRLDSIVRQTYPIYELIVLDDCSSDNSVEVIERKLAKINKQYPNIKTRIVKNEKNSGKAMRQWKKGFELATGDYVWIAEADDLSSRRFLAEVMRGFDDPDVVISYAESMIINKMGLMVAPNFRWSRDKEKSGHYKRNYIKDGKDEIREIMAIRCTIPNVSSAVIKRDNNYLKYLDEALEFAQVGDWYFYVKILEGGKIAYNRKALNRFRVHSGSVTGKSKKGAKHFEEVEKMHDYFERRYRLDEKVRKAMKTERNRIRLRYGVE